MPTTSKLRITTNRRATAPAQPAGRRLPALRPPTAPGEMLRHEFLEPLGLSQAAFAKQLGVSYPRLHDVVHGKRGVTEDTALRLARVTGMSAEFWLGLQQDWDLWHLRHARVSRDIAQLRPLARTVAGRERAVAAPGAH